MKKNLNCEECTWARFDMKVGPVCSFPMPPWAEAQLLQERRLLVNSRPVGYARNCVHYQEEKRRSKHERQE